MRLLSFLAACLLAGAPATAQSFVFRTAPLADTTLAAVVVRTGVRDTLTAQAFADQVMPTVQQNPMLQSDAAALAQLQRQVLEAFVLRPLVDAEVRQRPDLAVDTAAVSARIGEFVAQMGGPDGFNVQLEAAGLTLDSLRTLLGMQQRQAALFEAWTEDLPAPTDAEIDAAQRRLGEEVQVRHIIFDGGGSTDAYALAVRVLDSLRAGADFAAMARRHSIDGTAESGGVIDFFSREGPLDASFKRAAFALAAPGDLVPEPVRSAFGWHLLRLDERRMGEGPDRAYVLGHLTGRAHNRRIVERLQALMEREQVVVHVNTRVAPVDLSVPLPDEDIP